MYISLILEYWESCVVTQQLSFLFCKVICKAVCNSPVKVEQTSVDFSISAEGDSFVFLAIPQRVPRLSSAQCALHLEMKHAIKPTIWVATQARVAISLRVRK